MSEKLHVGSGWEEVTVGDASKRYYRVSVDLGGLIPPIYCRIAENSKPKSERSPSHYMFMSPVDGLDRIGPLVFALVIYKAEALVAQRIDRHALSRSCLRPMNRLRAVGCCRAT